MQDVFRLSAPVYEQLEKQLPKAVVGKDSTELMVAYNLGIQYVLNLLRNGFTVDADNQAREPSFRTRAR